MLYKSGRRSFVFAAPTIWNCLPVSPRFTPFHSHYFHTPLSTKCGGAAQKVVTKATAIAVVTKVTAFALPIPPF